MFTCIHVCVCVCVCASTCMHVYACMFWCMPVCVCVCAYACPCAHTHTHTHTHILPHTHTCVWFSCLFSVISFHSGRSEHGSSLSPSAVVFQPFTPPAPISAAPRSPPLEFHHRLLIHSALLRCVRSGRSMGSGLGGRSQPPSAAVGVTSRSLFVCGCWRFQVLVLFLCSPAV